MAAFKQLDWTRFDVWATVENGGVSVVETAHRDACRAWLQQHDYAITSIDFAQGIGLAVEDFGRQLRWEDQFGYRLEPDSRNLDALRDGFQFDLEPGRGHVLELLNADIANREDSKWLAGLLAIVHEYSLWQLALGARFFAILYLDRASSLVGAAYDTLTIPIPFWTPGPQENLFAVIPSKLDDIE